MKTWVLIILGIFTLFATILNFLPHLGYPYPLHVDEWVHFQYANHLSSNSPLYFGQVYQGNLEAGFHYLLATLNSIGINYALMFNFFPAIITILICLGVFILTRRMFGEVAGLFAVLFISLLQSSVAILGPVFLVPMAIGLFLLAMGLYLVYIKSNAWVIIFASLLIIHPPTALAFFLLINIQFLINREDYWRNILLQLLAGLIALPLYLPIFLSKGVATMDSLTFTQIISPLNVISFVGWFLIIIAILGIYFSMQEKKYITPISITILLLFILLAYHFKVEFFLPYARTLMYLFLILAVSFGLGCARIIEFSKNKKIMLIIALLLVVLILLSSLPAKLQSNNYIYHIVNATDISAFQWIKQNTDKNAIAILDPWEANAFTPIAERQVYSRIVQGPNAFYEARNKEIANFFNNNCINTSFLRQNNISIVYGNCKNSDLIQKFPQVFLLK